MVFNNGKETTVNQHMKAKAVELAEVLSVKLDEHIWNSVQELIENTVDQITDHDTFISKAKSIVKVHSFRVWFYKKESNNEIYAIGLSDVSFKGVQCLLYRDINFRELKKVKMCELPELNFIEDLSSENKDYHLLMHKIKEHSKHSKSNNSLNSLAINRQRLKLLA